MLASSTEESEVRDPWVSRMWKLPATVVSTTLEERLDWPDATVASGDAVDVVARLEEPIFEAAADFDLELIESRTLDGHIEELVYRPTLHV
jgi:hypothetical protein